MRAAVFETRFTLTAKFYLNTEKTLRTLMYTGIHLKFSDTDYYAQVPSLDTNQTHTIPGMLKQVATRGFLVYQMGIKRMVHSEKTAHMNFHDFILYKCGH